MGFLNWGNDPPVPPHLQQKNAPRCLLCKGTGAEPFENPELGVDLVRECTGCGGLGFFRRGDVERPGYKAALVSIFRARQLKSD
jgi:hypothetical protein